MSVKALPLYSAPICFKSWRFIPFFISILLLQGCNTEPVKKFNTLTKPYQDAYVQHIERVAPHSGLYSHVEQTEGQPGVYRLRVEGNTLVPTLDTERTFDEDMAQYCLTHPQEHQPAQPVHVLTKESKIINTFYGSVFEVRGTFKCEAVVVTPPPLNPPLPPTKLPPFTIQLEKSDTPSAKKKMTKTVKHKITVKRSCHCIYPPEKATPPPSKTAPLPALPSAPLPAPNATNPLLRPSSAPRAI